jgi:hypothetical protein
MTFLQYVSPYISHTMISNFYAFKKHMEWFASLFFFFSSSYSPSSSSSSSSSSSWILSTY